MSPPKIFNFVEDVLQSQLLDADQRDKLLRLQTTAKSARDLAEELLRRDWLTAYQINQIFQGKGANLILGPYILLERVGEGGMGQVFKARQKMLQRTVALKVIRKECLKNPKVTLRFLREIRAAGQLSHPHIVRAYDADQVNGTYYIAMEYIDGFDLAQLVKDEGPLRVDRACEYIRQAAIGLQHAFERGLVHRDIKPANLLVTRAVSSDRRRSSGFHKRPLILDERKQNNPPRPEAAQAYPWGVIKILDMGLARCNDTFTSRASTHLTQIGSVMGTPEFIAPEQARDSHTSDVRADLYSLGCTLYFLLTGLPPFPEGTLTEKLLQHQFEQAPSVRGLRRARLLAWQEAHESAPVDESIFGVPRPVEELICKLLEKDPKDRHQTPTELANDLQGIMQQFLDGSLMAKEAAEQTATIPVVPTAPAAVQETANSKTVILQAESFPAPAPRPKRRSRFAAKVAVVAATLSGIAIVSALTLLAILMNGNNPVPANTKSLERPKSKLKSDDVKRKQGDR